MLSFCHEKNANMKIAFNKNIKFEKQGVCVGENDVYFDYTVVEDHLMDGSIPWRGTHEKHPTLIQMFIGALCKLGGVVVDVTSSTCGFVILSFAFMFQYKCHYNNFVSFRCLSPCMS